MQLKESFAFDKQSFKILGFTDVGKATPENQKEKLGNHAVVIMSCTNHFLVHGFNP